jgi:hypothetical protein
LLPEAGRILEQAIEARGRMDEAEQSWNAMLHHVQTDGGSRFDPGRALQLRARRDAEIAELRRHMASLEEWGVLVKDLDSGLLDFPTLYRGQEVLLCWKLGEPSIAWWHGTEEGFRGRRRIDSEFLATHRGGAAH